MDTREGDEALNSAFVEGNDSSSSFSGQFNYNAGGGATAQAGGFMGGGFRSNGIGGGIGGFAISNFGNRDEQRQAAMLNTGEFENLFFETKAMIKEKHYKKVLQLLEQYRHEKSLSVSQKILMNRRMLLCSNKILKLYSHDVDVESEEKIMQLIERTVRLLSDTYRFLNLYICKILPNTLNDAFLEDASHLTSEDEADRFPVKRLKSAFESLSSYDLPFDRLREDNKYTQQTYTDDRIYKMINERYNQPLRIDFELDQYIMNLLQFFLRVSNIYKRTNKFRISFFYLKEANRIGDEVSSYQNPEIVHLCAKIKISYANFYFEASQKNSTTQKAIDLTEEAIFLLQMELRLRVCIKQQQQQQQPNSQSSMSTRDASRHENCVKTLIISLINLSLFYEDTKDYKRLYETTQLAEFISQKFLKGVDEVKKYTGKIYQEMNKRYENYLMELGEFDLICRQVLWMEVNELQREWDQQQPSPDEIFVSNFNNHFYERFKVRDLNSILRFKTLKQEKIYIKAEHMQKKGIPPTINGNQNPTANGATSEGVNSALGKKDESVKLKWNSKKKIPHQLSSGEETFGEDFSIPEEGLNSYDLSVKSPNPPLSKVHGAYNNGRGIIQSTTPWNSSAAESTRLSQATGLSQNQGGTTQFFSKLDKINESEVGEEENFFGESNHNSDSDHRTTKKNNKNHIGLKSGGNLNNKNDDMDDNTNTISSKKSQQSLLRNSNTNQENKGSGNMRQQFAKDTHSSPSISEADDESNSEEGSSDEDNHEGHFHRRRRNSRNDDDDMDEDDDDEDGRDSMTRDSQQKRSDMSFFDLGASFFEHDDFDENWKSSIKQSIFEPSETQSLLDKQPITQSDKQSTMQKSQTGKKKTNNYLGIDPLTLKQKPTFIKNHHPDFKTKVLTTNEYFHPYVRPSTPKKALKRIIDENIEKFQKVLRYPRNAEEFHVKYLEEHINKIVVEKVERQKIRDIKAMHRESDLEQDKNEMDKKRFEFARKMVHLKILRNLNPNFKDIHEEMEIDDQLDLERTTEFVYMTSKVSREIDMIKQIKKDRNVELVIDKGLNVDMTDEMTKALESKLQEKKKKKSMREAIFKYRDNYLFSNARNLKTVYQTYLGQLRELDRMDRLRKEQHERDRHKEEELKYNERQMQQQLLNKQDSSEQSAHLILAGSNSNLRSSMNSKQHANAISNNNNNSNLNPNSAAAAIATALVGNAGIDSMSQQPNLNVPSAGFPSASMPSQQLIGQTPKSSVSILKQHYTNIDEKKQNKKSMYQSSGSIKIEKNISFNTSNLNPRPANTNTGGVTSSNTYLKDSVISISDSSNSQGLKQLRAKSLKSKSTNNLKQGNNVQSNQLGSSSLSNSQLILSKTAMAEQEALELRQKAMTRNPSFKKMYRNSLYDVNLCRFDTKQRADEEARKAQLAEEKLIRARMLENMMIYYGASSQSPEQPIESLQIPAAPSSSKGGGVNALSAHTSPTSAAGKKATFATGTGASTKAAQSAAQASSHSNTASKIKSTVNDQMVDQHHHHHHYHGSHNQYEHFNEKTQQRRLLQEKELRIQNGDATSKSAQNATASATATTAAAAHVQNAANNYLDPAYAYRLQATSTGEYKKPEYFKEQSNKVIKLVATDVESNLRDTYEEHFQIKYKVEPKNKNKKFDFEKMEIGKRLVKDFSNLRQSTFQPTDVFIQIPKPKNFMDITKLRLQSAQQKKSD